VRQWLIHEYEAEKSSWLNELDVRKPFEESITQRSEDLRLYNVVPVFDDFKPLLNSGIFKCTSL
jgi:hypothetical protein